MVAPATEQIAREFGITSSVVLAMTVSIFVLAYGEQTSLQSFRILW